MTHHQHAGRDIGWEVQGAGICTDRDQVGREWVMRHICLIQHPGIDLDSIDLPRDLRHLPGQPQVTCTDIENNVSRTQLIEHRLIGRLIIVSMQRFPIGI